MQRGLHGSGGPTNESAEANLAGPQEVARRLRRHPMPRRTVAFRC